MPLFQVCSAAALRGAISWRNYAVHIDTAQRCHIATSEELHPAGLVNKGYVCTLQVQQEAIELSAVVGDTPTTGSSSQRGALETAWLSPLVLPGRRSSWA